MSRRRSLKMLTALAAASLVVAACSGDDDDDAVSGDTTEESGGAEPAATTEGTEGSDTTTADTTESTETETTEAETDGTAAELPGAENVGVEGGSGCGIPHGPYDDPGEAVGEVRVAWNDPLLSYNDQSARGNALANGIPKYLMGLGNYGGFSYYDGDLNYVNNDQFGTCTVESLDPLTVTYQVNEDVTWSDGTPIDGADLLLQWAARSAVFNDAATVITADGTTAAADAEGNPVILDAGGTAVPFAPELFDPETEELLPGLHLPGGHGCQLRRGQRGTEPRHPDAGGVRGRSGRHRDVGLVLRRLPDRRHLHRHASPHRGQEGARHRGPGRGQAGDHRRHPERRHGGAQADLGVLEHRLRLHQPARRPRPVPQRRPLQPDRLRRAQPDDVRGEPGVHVRARVRRSPRSFTASSAIPPRPCRPWRTRRST